MRLPLLLLLLLLHAARAEDFVTFCKYNFYGPDGSLSADGRTCHKTINFVDNRSSLFRYCQSQKFTGQLVDTSITDKDFVCKFDMQISCPPGYEMIQSLCYRLRPNSGSPGRDNVCQLADSDSQARNRVSKTIGALLLQLTARQNIETVWMHIYRTRFGENEKDNRVMSISGSRFASGAFRGESKVTADVNEKHHVICVREPNPSVPSLEHWCNVYKSVLLMAAQYDDSVKACFYLTYNHYTLNMHGDGDLAAKNIALHTKCRLFFDEDRSPVDVNFLTSKRFDFYMTDRPMRIPGAPTKIANYKNVNDWRVYMSDGDKTSASAHMWNKMENPQEGVPGAPFTLTLAHTDQGMKLHGVAPYTPLPVLCVSSLATEKKNIGECTCAAPAVCDPVTPGKCMCPNIDMAHKYETSHRPGLPVPTGTLCFDCPPTNLFVLLPLERCVDMDEMKKITTMIYKRYNFEQDANQRRMMIIPYQYKKDPPVMLDGGSTTLADFEAALNRVQKGPHRLSLQSYPELADFCRDNNAQLDYFTFSDTNERQYRMDDAHYPHTAFDAVARFLDRNPQEQQKNNVIAYFTHYPIEHPWRGVLHCSAGSRKYVSSASVWKDGVTSLRQSYNALTTAHPRVKTVAIRAESMCYLKKNSENSVANVGFDSILRYTYASSGKTGLRGREHEVLKELDHLVCRTNAALGQYTARIVD